MVARSKGYTIFIYVLVILLLLPMISQGNTIPIQSPRELIIKVADKVLQDFRSPPYFDWGEGVLMAGMMRAYQLTGETKYLKFIENFAEYWHKKGIDDLLHKGKRPNRPGYCGHWGPGYAMVELYRTNKNQHAFDLAQKVGRFIMDYAERTSEGGLCHFMGEKQLWVDTLFMCCPFLNEWAKSTGKAEFQDEAVHQLKVHIKYLQDPESGLFVHMWDEGTRESTTDLWGRGNGWAALSLVEVLKDMNPGSPDYPFLQRTYEKILSGILKHQDKKSGFWHTILDDPETYFESSASAMFLYALLLNRKHNIVDTHCDSAIQKAWNGLARLVQENGIFSGVSEGTDPSNKNEYAARKIGTYTWGTGAFLLAACEYSSGL